MANARLTMIGAYKYDPELFNSLDLPSSIDRETAINNILIRCGESPLLYDNPDFIKLMIGTWSRKWKDSIERMLLALEEEYNPLHNFDRYEKFDDEKHNTDSNRTDGELNRTTSQNKTDTTTYNSNLESKTTYDSSITEGSEIDEDITYSGSDTTLNDVSAFNESNYQPSSKNSLTSSNTSGRDMTEDKTTEHTGDDTRLDKHTGKDELKTVDSQSLKDINAESKSGKFDETSKHDGHLYGNIGVTTSQQMLHSELDLRSKVNIYDVIAEMFYKEFCVYVY